MCFDPAGLEGLYGCFLCRLQKSSSISIHLLRHPTEAFHGNFRQEVNETRQAKAEHVPGAAEPAQRRCLRQRQGLPRCEFSACEVLCPLLFTLRFLFSSTSLPTFIVCRISHGENTSRPGHQCSTHTLLICTNPFTSSTLCYIQDLSLISLLCDLCFLENIDWELTSMTAFLISYLFNVSK